MICQRLQQFLECRMGGVRRSLDVCGNHFDRAAVTGIRGPVVARLDRARLSPACAGADRTHRRPRVATSGRRQGQKRDEIRLGRDDGPSRALDASGASAGRGPFYFAWGCFRAFCVWTPAVYRRRVSALRSGQPIPLWCTRDRRALPAKQTSAGGQKTAAKSRSSRFGRPPAARLGRFWALVFRRID
jgi:hypothetical protein